MADNNQQSHLNGHSLASMADRIELLHQQGLKEEAENKGYVWTLSFDGVSTMSALGLASVNYNLHLSASHVGETVFGVYRGEMAMDWNADIAPTKLLMGLIGFKTSEDMEGWFKNNRFVMDLKPYDKTEEDGFIETFDSRENREPEKTGDSTIDAASKAGYDLAMSFVNAITQSIGSGQQTEIKEEIKNEVASGLWYDWDCRMTEGDMSSYFKMSGLNGYYGGKAQGQVDSEGKNVQGSTTISAILSPVFNSSVNEKIENPFPYTIKVYPDSKAVFTFYSVKDPSVKVMWTGKIDCIPVSSTTVVK